MEKYKKIYKGDVEITKIFVGNEKVWPSGPSLPTGIMTFEDAYAKTYCVNNWGSDGEITYEQARAVTDIGLAFKAKPDMVSFNELQYFTGITSIPNQAFEGDTNLVSVVLPNTITSIGDYAFRDCSGLTSITIPNSVTSIESYAFRSCSKLRSVTIGNSVTSIGDNAFSSCRGLTSVTIPNSVTSIGNSAFYDCSGLTSITIPNSVTSIGYSAFRYCSKLRSVTIGNSVTSIGDNAFASCSVLTSVILKRTITPITTIAATNVFYATPYSLVIKVPRARLDDYKTAANWSKYASKMVGY